MIRNGVRYEYCNGRAGGNKKPQPHGESFCGKKTIRKNDKK